MLLHIRPGVKFQDGEVMDAAAVKFSLDRYLTTPGSYRRRRSARSTMSRWSIPPRCGSC